MTGTIVQVNVSRGGVPKRAIPSGEVTEAGIAGDAWRFPFHGGTLKAILLVTAEGLDEVCDHAFLLSFQHPITSSNESRPPSGRARAEAILRSSLVRLGRSYALAGCRLSLATGFFSERGYAGTAASSSISSTTPRVFCGSTWIPGPMDVVSVIVRM